VAAVAVLRPGPDPLVGDRQALLTDPAQGRVDESREIGGEKFRGAAIEMSLDGMSGQFGKCGINSDKSTGWVKKGKSKRSLRHQTSEEVGV
jgi:hypothetical protein